MELDPEIVINIYNEATNSLLIALQNYSLTPMNKEIDGTSPSSEEFYQNTMPKNIVKTIRSLLNCLKNCFQRISILEIPDLFSQYLNEILNQSEFYPVSIDLATEIVQKFHEQTFEIDISNIINAAIYCFHPYRKYEYKFIKTCESALNLLYELVQNDSYFEKVHESFAENPDLLEKCSNTTEIGIQINMARIYSIVVQKHQSSPIIDDKAISMCLSIMHDQDYIEIGIDFFLSYLTYLVSTKNEKYSEIITQLAEVSEEIGECINQDSPELSSKASELMKIISS